MRNKALWALSVTGLAVAALASPAIATAASPPDLLSPADGATLQAGHPLWSFALKARVADAAPSPVYFSVSTTPATDWTGVLKTAYGGRMQALPSGSGPATYIANPAGAAQPYTWTPGTYYWQAFYADGCTLDPTKDCLVESAIRSFRVKQQPLPETYLNSHPPLKTRSRTASFAFSSNLSRTYFECRLVGAVRWSPCRSPRTYYHLERGRSYTFFVRAVLVPKVGPALRDQTPASWTFYVRRRR